MPEISPTKNFHGEIRVASRIIDYLSSGLYHTPAACLKELVNNSYDALASRVNIFVKPDADRIIIEDDGIGMNAVEFRTHFDRISESHKRDDDNPMRFGRKKIGKIGIGFIAANEICEIMEIFSTKKGSKELLHVTIDFHEMRKSPEERKRADGKDYAKADYEGEILEAKEDDHYTHLFLRSVRGEARQILAGATAPSQKVGDQSRSLYGLKSSSVEEALKDPTLNTWKQFDAYSQTMLQVALNVPVNYFEHWIPANLRRKLQCFPEALEALHFAVNYDGTSVAKPTVLNADENRAIAHKFDFKGEFVAASGYFYAQHGSIRPQELHGLLLRIRHAAVGEYDPSFLGFSPRESPLIQRWVSAEIWADDRLEVAMNIDRRTLREAHPAFVELRNAIHEQLRSFLGDARSQLYERGSQERKEAKSVTAVETARRIAKDFLAPVSQKQADSFIEKWEEAASEPKQQKVMLRKYSTIEVYDAVLEVAKEVMTSSQLKKFIELLSKRLGL